MTFEVTGIGVGDVALSYSEETIDGARYLATKMKDNGVKDVTIRDASGNAIGEVANYKQLKDHWRAALR